MIIECINCSKKFDVNSDLIPSAGRNIQCGSCNHIWFYTPNTPKSSDLTSAPLAQDNNILSENEINKKINFKDKQETLHEEVALNSDNTKSVFNLSKFLSYFLVIIISVIALIIILDTFKSPISDVYPGVEIFLYNLIETLKDIHLFLKNLLI